MTKPVTVAALLALVAALAVPAPALADDTRCDGALGPVLVDNVVVPRGEFCALEGSQVRGNVKVERDAGLEATGARIGGSIDCDGCALTDIFETSIEGNLQATRQRQGSFVCDSTVRGNLEFIASAPFVVVGERDFFCPGNTVRGNLRVERNSGEIAVSDNEIAGNLELLGNRGTTVVSRNRVREKLECKENQPPPVGAGNVAAERSGQCETLGSPEGDQSSANGEGPSLRELRDRSPEASVPSRERQKAGQADDQEAGR